MTSRRDLGPVLGAVGALTAAAAIVAGFIVVGGPGEARAERFDHMTMERITTIANAARCVMTVSGSAPATRADLLARLRMGGLPIENCGYIDLTQIEASEEIEYAALGASMIRVCGVFKTESEPHDDQISFIGESFPELAVERPAGRHCYDVRLRPFPASGIPPYPQEQTAEPVPAPPLQ